MYFLYVLLSCYVCMFVHKVTRKVCLFELILNVPVNNKCHVGTVPPFYGTFTQNEDVMTSNKCL